ncbi:MAG TPA: hypothetical protein VNN13_07395 [Methylomirabilota bacterium]|nr:hypothetical protein [Methylomirabilota bacterium]
MTQSDFARLVGLDQSVISRAVSNGICNPATGWKRALRQFVAHRSSTAAGRQSENGLDLCEERAALARAQREKIEFDLRKARDEFIPKQLVINILSASHAMARNRILGWPARLRSMLPELPPRGFAIADDLVREILTELAHDSFPAVIHEQLRAWRDEAKEPEAISHESRGPRGRTSKTRARNRAGRNRRRFTKTQQNLESIQTAPKSGPAQAM